MKLPKILPGPRHEQGLSLIEIAVTLVVVALVLSGILAAQELITQGRIKAVVADVNSLTAAYYAYQDRYAALPGDDAHAAARWAAGGARDGNGDGFIAGGYDDTPPAASALGTFPINATAGETLNYWWHLRLAGFVPRPAGLASMASQPQNAFGGIVGIQMNGAGLAGPTLCQANLPGKIAAAVDAQLDDTRPATGRVRGLRQTVTPQPLATALPASVYQEDGTSIYVLCRLQ